MKQLLRKESYGKGAAAATTVKSTAAATTTIAKLGIESSFRFFKLTMTSHGFTGTDNSQGKHVAITHLEFYECQNGS